jgi:hypothetical protein
MTGLVAGLLGLVDVLGELPPGQTGEHGHGGELLSELGLVGHDVLPKRALAILT